MFGAKSNPKTHACFGKSFVAAQWEAHAVVSKNPSGKLMLSCARILVGFQSHTSQGGKSFRGVMLSKKTVEE